MSIMDFGALGAAAAGGAADGAAGGAAEGAAGGDAWGGATSAVRLARCSGMPRPRVPAQRPAEGLTKA
jgi:hypothetical protein